MNRPPLSANPEQQAAIEHGDGPLQIIAGAGTGKTRTLVERIGHLVRTGRAAPGQILALTFTNKAATELRHRLALAGPNGESPADVFTYNAFGGAVVQEFGHHIGLPTTVRLLTPAEAWIVLYDVLPAVELHAVDLFNLRSEFGSPLKAALDFNARLNDELVSTDQLRALAGNWPLGTADADLLDDYVALALAYRQRLVELGAIDFGQQVALAADLLTHDAVVATLGDRYRQIVVDEYQDTNYAQAVMVQRLAAPHRQVTIVGDPLQAIYGFRGAAPDNLDRFRAVFPDARTVHLRRNYRSTQAILNAANAVWDGVVGIGRGTLVSAVDAGGQLPQEIVAADEAAEADFLAREIRALLATDRYRPLDIAILVRKNEYKLGLWRALRARGLPVRVVGNTDLLLQPVIVDLVAMLRLVVNGDDDASLAQVVLSPRWNFDEAALHTLRRASPRESLLTALQQAAETHRQPSAVAFLDAYRRLVSVHQRRSLPALVAAARRLQQSVADNGDMANLAAFSAFVAEFAAARQADEPIADLLRYIDLVGSVGSDMEQAECGSDDDAVTVMTAHAAKGLEWPVVFVAGASQADFTLRETKDALPDALVHEAYHHPAETGQPGQEAVELSAAEREERRVFYVAVTRARERLYLVRRLRPLSRGKQRPRLKAMARMDPSLTIDRVTSTSADRAAPTVGHLAAALPADRQTGDKLTAALAEFAAHHPELPIGEPEFQERVRQGVNGRVARHASALAALQTDDVQPSWRPGGPMLSYTAIRAYEACPRRYYLGYVRRLPRPPGPRATDLGSAFHQAVERHGRALQAGESVSRTTLVNWVAEGYTAVDDSVTPTRALTAAMSIDRLVDQYLAGPDAGARPLLVETDFEVAIGGGMVRGRIDRVQELADGTIELVDYKTDRSEPTQADVDASLQLALYTLACREQLGQAVDQATLVHVRTGKRFTVRYSTEALAAAGERLRQAVQAALAVDPSQVNLAACGSCDFVRVCSLGSQGDFGRAGGAATDR